MPVSPLLRTGQAPDGDQTSSSPISQLKRLPIFPHSKTIDTLRLEQYGLPTNGETLKEA